MKHFLSPVKVSLPRYKELPQENALYEALVPTFADMVAHWRGPETLAESVRESARRCGSQELLRRWTHGGEVGSRRVSLMWETMLRAEYERMGRAMVMNYGWHSSPFGESLWVAHEGRLCGLAFVTETGREGCLGAMRKRWYRSAFVDNPQATAALREQWMNGDSLALLLQGTEFQLHIWQKLLTLELGDGCHYSQLLTRRSHARAIGGAVGANPIGVLIPCHRVIGRDGLLHGFGWGLERKVAMLVHEAAVLGRLQDSETRHLANGAYNNTAAHNGERPNSVVSI